MKNNDLTEMEMGFIDQIARRRNCGRSHVIREALDRYINTPKSVQEEKLEGYIRSNNER